MSESEKPSENLSSLAKEGEVFAPSPAVIERAIVKDFDALHAQSIADPAAFWDEQAKQLDWFEPWNETLQWQTSPPELKWFVGGKFNISVNALDRHANQRAAIKSRFCGSANRMRAANRPNARLLMVNFRGASINAPMRLKKLGVGQGDRVTLYMALTPELPIAMLACARIGAIHSRGLRRLFRARAAKSHRRFAIESCDLLRHRLSARQANRSQRHRRRSRRRLGFY